jgi:multiple sugar transport system substrate-binding protein
MRRLFPLFLCLALLFVACDSDSSNEPSSNGDPEAPEESAITIQVSGEPEETAVYGDLAREYEESHEGASVEVIEIADGDDHLASLATSTAGGEPPDVFLINYREYAQFVAQDAVEPIEDLMVDRDVELSDYYEQSLDAFTYNDSLQCMPQNISSLVVYFNKKLFKAAGIEPAFDGWSFEEFRDAAVQLSSGSVDGLGVDPQIIRLAPFVWSNGGEVTDDPSAPTTFTLDEPASREALDAFVSLVRDDAVVPTEEELASQDAETRFIKGRLGMLLSSRRDTPLFREAVTLDWDVLPLPTLDEPASILHSDALCIAAGSDAIEAAADFVAYAMSPDGQTLIALSGRTVPSLTEIADSGAFLDPSQPPAHSQVWLDAIPGIRSTPVISTWPEIEATSEELLTRLFYEEDYDVDRFLEELKELTDPLFAEAE